MRIICPRCGTEYFLEDDQLDRDGTPVQCSTCEHVFSVFPPDRAPKEAPPPKSALRTSDLASTSVPPQRVAPLTAGVTAAPATAATSLPAADPAARAGGLFLAQGDRIYKVKDHSTLQRWIVEKRVLPTDRLSLDGKSWEVVSSRADLRPFFAVLEQLKAAKRALQSAPPSGAAISAVPSEIRPAVELPDRASATLKPPPVVPKEILAQRRSSRPAAPMPTAEAPRDPSVSTSMASSSLLSSSLSSASDSFFGGTRSLSETAGVPAAALRSEGVARTSEGALMKADLTSTRALAARSEEDLVAEAEAANAGAMTASQPLPDPKPVELPPAARAERNWNRPAPSPLAVAGEREASSHATTGHAPVLPSPADEAAGLSTAELDLGGGDGRFYAGLVAVVLLGGAGLWWYFGRPSEEERALSGGAAPPTAAADRGSAAEGSPAETTRAPAVTPPAEVAPEPPTTAPEPTPVVEAPTPAPPRVEPTPTAPLPQARVVAATPKPSQVQPKPADPRPATKKPDVAGGRTQAQESLADADRARERGDFAAATKGYQKVLGADPSNFHAALQLGWSQIELGQNGDAVAAFKKALGARPSSAEAHYGLGLAYQEMGRRAEARAEYERVIELDPGGRDAAEVRALLRRLE